MKKLIYVSFVSLLLLSSCHPIPHKWKDMPNDLFSSYFPYQEGDTIQFCSEDLDTLTYTCTYNIYRAELVGPRAYTVCNDLLINETTQKLFKSIDVWSLVYIDEPYDVNNKPVSGSTNISAYYGTGTDHEGTVDLWWDLAESTLYEIYTQDYDIANEDNSARFYLKKGEGIVWFEYEGVRYTQIK